MPHNPGDNDIFEGDISVKSEQDVETPRMFRVLMHNDHYTTMDFVVEVLIKVFSKQAAEATKIMLDIHNKGLGTCGVFTYDIAITKISQVHTLARTKKYPLRCSHEEA